MVRPPPCSTLPETLFPYTTLFGSRHSADRARLRRAREGRRARFRPSPHPRRSLPRARCGTAGLEGKRRFARRGFEAFDDPVDDGVDAHGKGVGAGQAERVGGLGAPSFGLGGRELRGVEIGRAWWRERVCKSV